MFNLNKQHELHLELLIHSNNVKIMVKNIVKTFLKILPGLTTFNSCDTVPLLLFWAMNEDSCSVHVQYV